MASITKRPDGVWRARYRDREGKEHARHFQRKVDAQQWLDETTANLVTGVWVNPSRARGTVQSQAEAWLSSHPDWTPSTRARNESIVKNYVMPRWGAVRLGDLTTDAIQGWTGELQLSPGSIRKVTGVLSGILDRAVQTKHLGLNPALGVVRPRQKLKRRRYLDAFQVETLADAAGRQRDIILVLSYCGLRFGEMAALTVSSVDQLRRRFMIEASVTEVNGQMEWSEPKDHQRRSVPFPAFLDDEIADRMRDRGLDDLLFASARGGVLRIGNARRDWFDPAARSAGLDGLTPHELRHTAASLAVKAGASVLAVQRMLGHDKPSTTLDVYADLFDEDLDRVAERLVSVRSAVLADYLRTEPRLVHRTDAS